MRIIRKLIALTLVTIVVLMCFPITVKATADSVWAGKFTILVDDVSFEPWGYSTDMAILYLCLFDMAYMLNGTSAQFDIRTPIDNRWDFWIIRGETYTPTGTEFQPIPWRFAARGSYGFIGWDRESGFDYYPEQTLIIGIDGTEKPVTSIAIRTIQDIDKPYFMVSDLAAILGFDYVITTDMWHPGRYHEDFVEGIDHILTTETRKPALLPVQSPELADILVRISGQWVDREHFYSPIINESVVWPAELSISYHGINKPMTESVAPIRPERTRSLWEWEWLWWYPVSMQTLENDLVALTVNQPEQAQPAWSIAFELEYSQEDFLHLSPRFQNYRIVLGPGQDRIENITLYIGDTPHIMYRIGLWCGGSRYTVEPAEGGGIMIRYVFSRWDLQRTEDMDFRIYRSTFPIELMRSVRNTRFDELAIEPIHSQIGITPDDRIIFEFIDTTIEHGQIYYYSFWRRDNDWRHNITPGNMFYPFEVSIRVVVNELLGITEPEFAESETDVFEVVPFEVVSIDAPETEISADAELYHAVDVDLYEGESSNTLNINWIWIAAAFAILAGVVVWIQLFRKQSGGISC